MSANMAGAGMGRPGRGQLNSGGPWVPREGIYPDGAGGMAIDPLCREEYSPGAGGIPSIFSPFPGGIRPPDIVPFPGIISGRHTPI